VFGGLLYEKTGYSGVFAIGASLLIIDLVMRLLMIEKKIAARYVAARQSSDSEESSGHHENGAQDGPATETTALLADSPRSDSEVDNAYKLSIPTSGLVAYLPVLACFQSPALIVSQLIGIVQALLLAGFDATVPLIGSEWYGFSSLKAGLLFLPLGIADLIIGTLAGWAIDIVGTKPVSVLGFIVMTPSFALMRVPRPGGMDQIAIYCTILTLCGVGTTVAGTPGLVEAGTVMEAYHKANPGLFGENGPYAQLYGITSMIFSLGLTLGPIVAGGLREQIGYGNMNAVLAAVCFVMGILSWLYIGKPWDWKRMRAPWSSKTT
jgi:hypothetical protein